MWVYPRGCGGTTGWLAEGESETGLSPRVRGNRDKERIRRPECGSIPAGAGEPPDGWQKGSRRQVYPRGCGGTTGWLAEGESETGLSPRVRGNPPSELSRVQVSGSIPAGAGEPWSCFRMGRSERSIPAGAGEPFIANVLRSSNEVYPRGCGGISSHPNPAFRGGGLSPRVRGNHTGGLGGPLPHRSIPAGAGEPCNGLQVARSVRVYPRGCGGTKHDRGSRRGSLGSIPAGAGEPLPCGRPRHAGMVYPRGCGGTPA